SLSSIAGSYQIDGVSDSLRSVRRHQLRSTSAMCRTSPCNDNLEVDTGRLLRSASVSPSHLRSNVVRWYSSHASNMSRSPSTKDGSRPAWIVDVVDHGQPPTRWE